MSPVAMNYLIHIIFVEDCMKIQRHEGIRIISSGASKFQILLFSIFVLAVFATVVWLIALVVSNIS